MEINPLFLHFQRQKKKEKEKKVDAARFLDTRGDEKQVIYLERPNLSELNWTELADQPDTVPRDKLGESSSCNLWVALTLRLPTRQHYIHPYHDSLSTVPLSNICPSVDLLQPKQNKKTHKKHTHADQKPFNSPGLDWGCFSFQKTRIPLSIIIISGGKSIVPFVVR